MNNDVAWLPEERLYADVVSMHAHYAIVKYIKEGIEYNIIVEHDEYDIIERERPDDDGS